MLSGEFQRKLRRLNRNLRIFCGDDNKRPAGLFHVVNGEYTEICGVDKNWVPKYAIVNPNGGIVKAGWYRILRILVGKGLVDKQYAQKVFGTYLEFTPTGRLKAKTDNVADKIRRLGMEIVERSQR